MDYALGVGLLAVGAAVFVLLRKLRPVSLVAFALAGFVMRNGVPGDVVRNGVAVASKWLGQSDAAILAPYVGIGLAVIAAAVLVSAVVEWDAGVGTVLVAVALPALLVLSGDAPPAVYILERLGWLQQQLATATKGTR